MSVKQYEKNGDSPSKRKFPRTETSVINDAVYGWLCQVRTQNIPVSGILIQEKALEVAKSFNISHFSASNGWLQKFGKRPGVKYKSICGESIDVDMAVVNDWFSRVKGICDAYSDRDVYNLDETGLFYTALPDKTMCLQNEKCSGGKLSKEWLTVMLCVNCTGEFKEPLVIGKSARPICFQKVDDLGSLGIVWKNNSKSWMTQSIMIPWLENFE
ncbi:hypothetical protein TKK_0016148 [Trichogramma kaykai]